MPRSYDDPPDGQPPTCVAVPDVGPIFDCLFHFAESTLALLAKSIQGSGNGNHRSRPLEQKCDFCDEPGVKPYDQNWCCEACGQALLDRLSEELVRPAPRQKQKPNSIRPGQRGRRKT
jgi:hypothetical protein